MADLLPLNATDQERAIAAAAARDVTVLVRETWNPDTCPVALLPWLAWAFNVDTWNAAWTDSQKRGVIKSSINVHRKKGTIGALRSALNGLGYDLAVQEWFQKAPAGDPYTFSIGIRVDQVGIASSAAFDQIVSVANSVKNLRSHLVAVDINAISSGQVYCAAKCITGEIVNISAEANT